MCNTDYFCLLIPYFDSCEESKRSENGAIDNLNETTNG